VAHFRLGTLRVSLGDFEKAEPLLAKAVELDPGNAAARASLAELQRRDERRLSAFPTGDLR
jgi:Tfp pilus assembly protein PilF